MTNSNSMENLNKGFKSFNPQIDDIDIIDPFFLNIDRINNAAGNQLNITIEYIFEGLYSVNIESGPHYFGSVELIDNGEWKDLEKGISGDDFISLAAYVHDISYSVAATHLASISNSDYVDGEYC